MAIYKSRDITTRYAELKAGDIVLGELGSAHQNSALLIDLMQRGVRCVPSPLSQLLSRSKVAQVDILGGDMLPLTLAIKRRKDLLDAINIYTEAGIGAVVTKEEHMHCGHGVRKWDQIETVYSFRGLEKESYPFVIQPLAKDFTDVRVIFVDDVVEAYVRSNHNNFRGNLCTGGESSRYDLNPRQVQFCRQIVDRAQFPYAHLDLQIMSDDRMYMFEITLNGGVHGSSMEPSDLTRQKEARLRHMADVLEMPR